MYEEKECTMNQLTESKEAHVRIREIGLGMKILYQNYPRVGMGVLFV